LGGLGGTSLPAVVKKKTGENEQQPDGGAERALPPQIYGKRQRAEAKYDRHPRITPGAVRARKLRLAPAQLPRFESVRIDGAVLLFSCVVSLIAGVLFGLVPALRMSRRDPQAALKDGGGTGRGRSARAAGLLVVFDAAIAFLLVFGAGLFVKSTARLLHVDPGFLAERVVKAEIDLSGPRYNDDAPVVAFYDRVLDRVRAIPGVVAAGAVSQLPLGGNTDSYGIHILEKPSANPENDPSADRYGASPALRRQLASTGDRA